ncbi:hypothetical protein OG897_26310 [Streptomyces sp. NBC_00237]|uniref:hypothetical protein n=1 Tax=Streptomyces sp. NBC_00237 TaxID=2975687 RepID=UPI0022593923|nr:hypothetical protein [Streptomyces sp. NBC_00237]MCX5204956.1 hypothetical protein [Streptomyces sp. NBC_00237]
MNLRNSPFATACAAIAAALLLTSCGGEGKDAAKPSGAIDGADADTAAKKPSAPGTPAPGSAARPPVNLPADVKNVFEGQKSGDPTKDAVLADNAERINAVDDAIVRGTADAKGLGFYNDGDALGTSVTFVQGYVDKKLTWTGTTRYFDRQVTSLKGGTATVAYCSDESRSFLKNRMTGKLDRTPTSADSYVFYNTQSKKNAQGVWQTTRVISQRGAAKCQP